MKVIRLDSSFGRKEAPAKPMIDIKINTPVLDSLKEWLTVSELAKYLDRSPRTIRRYLSENSIPYQINNSNGSRIYMKSQLKDLFEKYGVSIANTVNKIAKFKGNEEEFVFMGEKLESDGEYIFILNPHLARLLFDLDELSLDQFILYAERFGVLSDDGDGRLFSLPVEIFKANSRKAEGIIKNMTINRLG